MTHPLGMSSRHHRNGMCHASRRSPMSHARRSTRFLPVTVPAVVALGLITSMSPTWAESVPVPSTGTQQAPVAAAPTAETAGSFYYVPRSSAVHDDDIEVTRTLRRVDNELVPVTVTTVAVNRTVAQTVRFRAPYRAELLASVTLSGSVPVRSGARTHRIVLIQQWVSGGWRTIGRTSARLTGTFRTRMHASGRPMLARVRARVNKSAGKPAAASRARTIGFGSAAQVAELRMMDTAQDWTWLSDAHIRWAKCGLTWAYLPSGGYTGSEATARSAIAAVDAQTSFSFGQVPPSAGADITIRWATPQQEEDLAGGTLGYASVTATGDGALNSADVVLDQSEGAVGRTFDYRPMTWGSVMMHEITHGMGLSHALGRQQVMYPLSTSGTWGLGDRAGLAAVSSGC